ncbi:MAG: hypothetical protein KKD44_10050 [Proteobacteria bacterium]|nr:hypothetical protein [Pseudomonadota bacterium]
MIKENQTTSNMFKGRALSFFLVGLCVFCLGSCGYQLTGGGSLPAGVQTVFVSMFENRSSEIGMENTVVSDLIYEFNRNGQKVVTDSRDAHAILSGVIKSISVETVSYNADQTRMESRVIVIADVVFKGNDGAVIWSGEGLVQKQAFKSSREDKQVAEKNRKDALGLVSRRFAENVYARLTDDF